ncbi:MAG: DsbA family protein [Propionicimonas sp.]
MRPDASKKLAEARPKSGPNPVLVGVVVAVIVVVGVTIAVLMGNASRTVTGPRTSAQPIGVVGGTGGGILVNSTPPKSNAPTVDVYADFQCPVCGKFEETFGSTLTAMAKAGEVKYVVHMMSFLDLNLKNDSSARSANAAACAADAGKFAGYHSAVFAGQPAQEGAGYSGAQLGSFAATAGITGAELTTWQQCTSSGQHAKYVADVETSAEKAGVNSTPTVKLNGKNISSTLSTVAALADDIKAATR